jgi:hypothetical protein
MPPVYVSSAADPNDFARMSGRPGALRAGSRDRLADRAGSLPPGLTRS